jgi:organic hydroperoxide reductase OsmC/OhrA
VSEHCATVEWQRSGEFRYETYSRSHTEEHRTLHHRAHEKCYVANSVKTEIVLEPCLK